MYNCFNQSWYTLLHYVFMGELQWEKQLYIAWYKLAWDCRVTLFTLAKLQLTLYSATDQLIPVHSFAELKLRKNTIQRQTRAIRLRAFNEYASALLHKHLHVCIATILHSKMCFSHQLNAPSYFTLTCTKVDEILSNIYWTIA